MSPDLYWWPCGDGRYHIFTEPGQTTATPLCSPRIMTYNDRLGPRRDRVLVNQPTHAGPNDCRDCVRLAGLEVIG
jgi:hypothetical protein